jgi:hypothetical protein
VAYRIDLEFCLQTKVNSSSPNNAGKDSLFDNAFSFSIELKVLSSALHSTTETRVRSGGGAEGSETGYSSVHSSDENAHSSIALIQHRALQCMESSIFVVPV